MEIPAKGAWLASAAAKRGEWVAFRPARAEGPASSDPFWPHPVTTQPQAIAAADAWCRREKALTFFDAGVVQTCGFRLARDHSPFQTRAESGAPHTGFAVSALLSQGLADNGRFGVAFTGDGSVMTIPQVLIDAVAHCAHGTIPVATGADDRDAALAAAAQSFPVRAATPACDRAAVLRAAPDRLRTRADALARVMSTETGKSLAEARAEVTASAGPFQ